MKAPSFLLVILVTTSNIATGQVTDAEVRRVAGLQGAEQRKALASLVENADSLDQFFRYERRLHGSLLVMLRDPNYSRAATALLIMLGYPDDIRLILELSPPPDHRPDADNHWAYYVACAMLQPTTEREWQFLRSAAMNEYDDSWGDSGAIQTLRLIASPRGLQILEEARQHNADRADDIARAIKYIESNPVPLEEPNLESLAKRVAQALDVGKWIGNGPPRYNQARDKAQIDCQFGAGRDLYTYTATFHDVRGVWKPRGVWYTMQALLAPPAPRK